LEQKQKDYITDAVIATRENSCIFLDFIPQDKLLEGARSIIDEENKLKIEELKET
jgi:hypothetical protein